MKKRHIPTPCLAIVLNISKNKRHAAKILNVSTNDLFKFTKEPYDKPIYAHTTYPVVKISKEEEFVEYFFELTYDKVNYDTVGHLPERCRGFFRYS